MEGVFLRDKIYMILCSLKEAGLILQHVSICKNKTLLWYQKHLPRSGHNCVFDFDGVDVAAGPCRAGECSPTISSLTSRYTS